MFTLMVPVKHKKELSSALPMSLLEKLRGSCNSLTSTKKRGDKRAGYSIPMARTHQSTKNAPSLPTLRLE